MVDLIRSDRPRPEIVAPLSRYLSVADVESQDDLGVMDRDDITILLIARTPRHTGIGSCYFYVKNVDQLYAELSANGAKIQSEPVSHPWGLRDFPVLDLDGNQLSFGQTFE